MRKARIPEVRSGKTKSPEKYSGAKGTSLSFENLVRSRGLEPPCLAALAPQASASASSATTARNKLYIRTLFASERNDKFAMLTAQCLLLFRLRVRGRGRCFASWRRVGLRRGLRR